MSDTIRYSSAPGPLIEGEPVSYSFHVPGWYMVLGLLVLLCLVTTVVFLIRYRRNAYRREALRGVDAILQGEAGTWCYRIGLLLKDLAMTKFGRDRVASLQGMEWYAFLRSSSGPDGRFTESDFEDFTSYIYNGQVPDKILGNKLGDFARHWIRTHDAGRI